jgi:D-lactate dehydrogenase (cytochrome)
LTTGTFTMKCIIGKNNITQQVPELLYDESRFTLGVPQAAYFPTTPADVRAVVSEAYAGHTPITVIGGKTGIAGACVPVDNSIALCFSEMSHIRAIRRLSDGAPMLVCDPGVTLDAIETFLDSPESYSGTIQGIESLAGSRWFYPPDPTEMTAHLGGTVATNASGSRSFHFGPTRRYVEEISVVLADGDTARIMRGACREDNGTFTLVTDQGGTVTFHKPAYRFPDIKNASGYYSGNEMDLIDLFIGSEGTLAVFSEIGIRLLAKPRFVAGLSFFPDRKMAFSAASFFRGQKPIAAIEFFDATALRILEASREAMSLDLPQFPAGKDAAVYWEFIERPDDPFEEHFDEWETTLVRFGSSFESTWSGFEEKEMEKIKAFRHAVPEAVNSAIAHYKRVDPGIRKVSTDAALPGDGFDHVMDLWFDKISRSGLAHVVFGHLGDFHLHFNLIPHNESELTFAKRLYQEMMESAIAAGGTVSAEHGIGKLKTSYLARMYGKDAIDEMKRVKSALDPLWLLCRGNLFEYDPEQVLPKGTHGGQVRG